MNLSILSPRTLENDEMVLDFVERNDLNHFTVSNGSAGAHGISRIMWPIAGVGRRGLMSPPV